MALEEIKETAAFTINRAVPDDSPDRWFICTVREWGPDTAAAIAEYRPTVFHIMVDDAAKAATIRGLEQFAQLVQELSFRQPKRAIDLSPFGAFQHLEKLRIDGHIG